MIKGVHGGELNCKEVMNVEDMGMWLTTVNFETGMGEVAY